MKIFNWILLSRFEENFEVYDLRAKILQLERSNKMGLVQVKSREKEVKEFK